MKLDSRKNILIIGGIVLALWLLLSTRSSSQIKPADSAAEAQGIEWKLDVTKKAKLVLLKVKQSGFRILEVRRQ